MTFVKFIEQFEEEVIMDWYFGGCEHPCPPEVMSAKNNSGMTWDEFTDSLEELYD